MRDVSQYTGLQNSLKTYVAIGSTLSYLGCFYYTRGVVWLAGRFLFI